MYRKTLVFFTLLLYLELSGCCGCNSNANTRKYCVALNSAALTPYDNSQSEPELYNGDAIPGEALVLELKLNNNIEFCYETRKPAFSLVNRAYATSCGYRDEYFFDDSIVHVSISADKAYDEQHPPGAELNEYFKIPETHELNSGEETAEFMYYSLRAPSTAGDYVYNIKILFASSKLMEASTSPVKITP